MAELAYNKRLFRRGIRAKLHFARFHWLKKQLERLDFIPESYIELGCFDGRSIEYLPGKPSRYVGLDADWEGGLSHAKQVWKGEAGFQFLECRTPEDVAPIEQRFDICLALETLEHIPPELVEPYLLELASRTEKRAFFSVPNEKGLVFALKYIAKFVIGRRPPYTFREFIYATLGQTQRVARQEHKGFNYADLIQQLADHFEIVEVTGIPFRSLPCWLNFQVGIVAKRR